jgi:uncharacterized protein
MRILLTGASGFIGSSLGPFLTANQHQVLPLRRGPPNDTGPTWKPAANWIDLRPAGRLDAVIHLAGENLAQRWTPAAKARIKNSRVDGTRLLSETLARSSEPPRVLVCASAVGFYGDRGKEILDEQSSPGRGFLAEVCQSWEAAAEAARQRGIRVVHLRFGIVLGAHGGALAKMLPVFRLGLGGRLGNGRQYWSWIALDDLLRVVDLALNDDGVRGAVNAVTPGAMTNMEFTATLARVLGRPAFLSVPAFAVRLLFGEMGEEALLGSVRVRPARLAEIGFPFQFSELEPALRHLLSR